MARNYSHRNRRFVRPAWAGFFLWTCLCLLTVFTSGPSARSAEPRSLQEWLDLGWSYYNQGKREEAFKTFLQAASEFPDSSEAHLVLGLMYVEKGVINQARKEYTRSLQLDDTSPIAARTHYEFGLIIREEDTATALLHFNRSLELKGSTSLALEAAHQIRFCKLLVRLCGRSQSGLVVLHFFPGLISQAQGDALARKAEGLLYSVESFCSYDLTKAIHFFLYPSEDAIQVDIWNRNDYEDPEHREFHLVYFPALDMLPNLCRQVVTDLLTEKKVRLDRQSWIYMALPVAATGHLPTAGNGNIPSNGIDCDDAVRALVAGGKFVKIKYLYHEQLADQVPVEVKLAELGSYLRWVHANYSVKQLQALITDPDWSSVLDLDTDATQVKWLDDLSKSKSLLSNSKLAAEWAAGIPVSPLVEGAEQPEDIVREGIKLYLGGDTATGKLELYRAVDTYPGIGLGYFALGWVSCRENNWDEAEKRLSMAVMFFESPEDIAWSYAFLTPIYFRDEKWELAKSSLALVVSNLSQPDVRQWAGGLMTLISHLISLQPTEPVDRSSAEFDAMRDFISRWNAAVNSGRGIQPLIGKAMERTRALALSNSYGSIKKDHPTVVFNHALQVVGVSGSELLLAVRVQAGIQDSSPQLPSEVEDLVKTGRMRYFRMARINKKWQIEDWEDSPYPMESMRTLLAINPELGNLRYRTPFGGS